mgnify:FL=1
MIKVSRDTNSKLDEVQVGLDQIAAALVQLEAQLNQLKGEWNGDARVAFAEASRRWDRQIRNLNALAATARGQAQAHVENVGSFDTRRASAWTR